MKEHKAGFKTKADLLKEIEALKARVKELSEEILALQRKSNPEDKPF